MGSSGNCCSRNHGLDFLKGIAACSIVFVHVIFPKPFGLFVAYLASFAVSVFFMTAGYYSLGASKGKLLHSIKRTIGYLLVAYVLYLFKMLAKSGFHVGTVVDFLANEVFTVEHILKTLITSQSRICFIAWFLISLIICYVLKLLLGKRLRLLGYLGLAAGVIVCLPPIDNHMDFPISNPWMWGIPFFVMGELVHEHEEKLRSVLKTRYLVVLCLVGITISLLSRYYSTQGWHVGNMFIAPSLFMLFGWSGMRYHRFCLLGGTYAFFIYIVHPLVSTCYHALRVNPGTIELWLRPLIVLGATVLLAILYYNVKSMIVNRVKR